MDKNSGRFHVSLPIISKNYYDEKSEAAKFKGKLHWVSNQHGVIYDWKIEFDDIHLDQYTTLSWFKKIGYLDGGDNCFANREKLFSQLNLELIPRPNKKNKQEKLNAKQKEIVNRFFDTWNNYYNNTQIHKIITLKKNEIKKVNDFFNKRDKPPKEKKKGYNSTLNNIVAILKGSNPSGKVQKPNSAEMIIDPKEGIKYKNFVILIDDLVMKKKNYYTNYKATSKSISFNKFCELDENGNLKLLFEESQESRNQDQYDIYLKGIKKYYDDYKDTIINVDREVNKYRSRYYKAVKKQLEQYKKDHNGDLPFKIHKRKKIMYCHIEEVHYLKDLVINYARTRQDNLYKKYLERIADPNNCIPLPYDIHREFDDYIFTYNINGEACPLNKDGWQQLLEYYPHMQQYKQIPKDFLTKERIAYIKRRMEYINNFHLQSH